MSDLRPAVQSALQALASGPLRDSAKNLLKTLGYQSDRTLNLEGSKPQAFLDLIASQGGQSKFDESKALFSDWKSADILFQLSDTDISQERSLFKDTTVQPGLLQSYLFFAIELTGGDYARGKLTSIARQINRVFPMPVMLLIRHGDATGTPVLSIAVINRRRNKVHAEKDVLEKVTLIRDISLTDPHRGHLDILASFAVENLVHPKKLPITDFDSLHAAWEQIFNIELLNARFYRELSNWYFWALPQVEFPADLEPDDEKRRATGLIRLLTRLIFCWFLKEKNLIPEKLFHPTDLAKILKGFDPESETSSTYYQAILQNLFFATLNQRMGKDGNGKPYRLFATDEGFAKNRATYDVNNLYRYEKLFAGSQDDALAHFADIPFLNGGLFECLDRTEDGTDKKRYLDGFSRNAKKRPHVPDRLFFDSGETADLSTAYGDTKRKAEKVTGLITILNRYKFTIVENTPIDQEIALDPELLGKVFENLLASYNEETKTTARKQTGSFYTPRPIVDYMVDESLKAHLERKLVEGGAHAPSRVVSDAPVGNRSASPVDSNPTPVSCQSSARAPMTAREARALPIRERLDLLFAYTEDVPDFSELEKATLIAAIDALKILDPACGSGAFPMGVLHKLVYCLGKLDPDNDRWQQTQLAKLDSAPMREELERAFADNNDDYGRKLYLIENCLYGVDIQPIAIQITKLRFFISLVCDQKTNRNKKDNHGIRPLPNLETKFVAANTLIGLPGIHPDHELELTSMNIRGIQNRLQNVRHDYFSAQTRQKKISLQQQDKQLRSDLVEAVKVSYTANEVTARRLASWNPYDPHIAADFFEPLWMFDKSLVHGFDITIGNPPYVRADEQSDSNIAQRKAILANKQYETLWQNWDLYVPFLERSFKLLSAGGISTMIVSDAFCHSKYAQKAQNWFLQNARILRLDFCGAVKIFDAAVHNVITCFQNSDGSKWKPERRFHCGTFGELINLPSDEQANLTHRVFFPEQSNPTVFSSKTFRLADACYIAEGMHVNSDEKLTQGAFKMEDVVSPNQDNLHPKPFVEGKHLARWLPNSNRWLEWGTKRAPQMFRRKTFPEVYAVTHKILVQRSPGPDPKCCYDEFNLHYAESVIGFCPWHCLSGVRNLSLKKVARYRGEKPPRSDLPKREELEAISRRFSVLYLLGVMNSASARNYLRANRRSNIHLYADDWKQLPIPDVSAAQQKPIVDLVEQILTLKRANPTADISALETQLDAAVAALYGLTPEEIAIVEGTAP